MKKKAIRSVVHKIVHVISELVEKMTVEKLKGDLYDKNIK